MISTDQLLHLVDQTKFSVLNICPSVDLIFEERVKLLCFYCGKYGLKRTCPPQIPNLDWQKLVSEYQNGLILYQATPFDKEITPESRRVSTMDLYDVLRTLEGALHASGHPLAVCFGGGSCKICETETEGCTVECHHPVDSRIPIEAMGVNVEKTLLGFGVFLPFPPQYEYFRVGLVLW